MAGAAKDNSQAVKQKVSSGSFTTGYATKIRGNDKYWEEYDSQGRKSKAPQEQIKRKDFMAVMNMLDLKNSQDHNNTSIIKSTKQRREVFTDGLQLGKQDVRKKMVSSDSIKNEQHTKKYMHKEPATTTSLKAKRHHTAKELSPVTSNHKTLSKHKGKHRRHKLHEENPADLGGILHEKLKNWSPHIDSNGKGKIPFLNSKSKSYDLLKGQADQTTSNNNSLRHSGSLEIPNSEIYISLEKKSPQEKEECIKQSKANFFSDNGELHDSTLCENTKGPEDYQNFS